MYKVEKNEKYQIYCWKRWYEWPEGVSQIQIHIYGEKPKICYDSYVSLDFVCEKFRDVLKYFVNYYRKSMFESLEDSFSYISMCYVVDHDGRIIYPSIFKYEIRKMIERNDSKYESTVFDYKYYNDHPYVSYKNLNKKSFVQTYEFRKNPIPHSGKWIYHQPWYFGANKFVHCGRFYDIKNFEIDREELDELGIDYYIPQQKKKERKPDFEYGWTVRHVDKSWKTSFKCKKQWMKHKKGCKPYDKRQYDMEYEEEILE